MPVSVLAELYVSYLETTLLILLGGLDGGGTFALQISRLLITQGADFFFICIINLITTFLC